MMSYKEEYLKAFKENDLPGVFNFMKSRMQKMTHAFTQAYKLEKEELPLSAAVHYLAYKGTYAMLDESDKKFVDTLIAKANVITVAVRFGGEED